MAKTKGGLAKATTATRTISLRLLRSDRTVDDAVRARRELTEHPSSAGRLFYDQSVDMPPSWLDLVNEFATDSPLELRNKHCAAILFLEVASGGSTRTFALAFGGGHLALQPDAFERNFGLKVALNSIARADLKNLDVATLEATSFQKRVQASRKSDLGDFGIDTEQDLLRLAGGVPTDASFANSLTGKDALTLTAKISASALTDKCKEALKLFDATDYKKDYAFIDQISPVRENDLVTALDALLFAEIERLLEDKGSDLHLTIPEIIDPEATHEIGYFGTGFRPGGKTGYDELAIEDYVAELKAGKPSEITSIADVKTGQEIRVVVDGQGDKKRRKRVYDCFVWEVTHSAKAYVLFAGDWYCIEKQFHASVEADFQKFLVANPFIAKTTATNEQKLIEELDKDPDLLKMDQVKVSPAGAAGANLEPCDFLSRDKAFIHLKDGHGSAPISHLWSQGVVATESFVRDEAFRVAARKAAIVRQKKTGKTGFETLLPDGRSKPVPSEYKVIFGILRHPYQRSKKLGLPFFSKVSLRAAATRIELMGFTVEVHLIEKS